MQRRDLLILIGSLPVLGCTRASAAPRGPLFWQAKRGAARVFVLGFTDARDRAWLTPSIQRAFNESSELWLETAGPQDPQPPDGKPFPELIQELGFDQERTFYESLE